MHLFIEANSNYDELAKECEKENIKPIALFLLNLENKNQIKENLQNFREFIKNNTLQKTAIQIELGKKESWKLGTINQLKQEFDIIMGRGGLNSTNRYFLEQTKIDFLINPQSTKEKGKIDFMHHFNMGLNQILFTFAKQQNKHICLFLDELPKINFFKAKEIGRITKSNQLANKYDVQVHIQFLIKKKEDIRSTFMTQHIMDYLNLSTKNRVKSLKILETTYNKNLEMKTDEFICDGIKIIN